MPDGGSPVMRLQDPGGGFTDLALDAGTRLGFRLAAGENPVSGTTRSTGQLTGITSFARTGRRP